MILPTPDHIWAKLRTVLDPETNLNLVDMGLIYDVQIKPSRTGELIWITYSLTTPACPLAGEFQRRIRVAVAELLPPDMDPDETVITELVFEPVWTIDRLSAEARAELGF